MEDVEEIMLPAPLLRTVVGTYRGMRVCVSELYFGAPASVMGLEVLVALGRGSS